MDYLWASCSAGSSGWTVRVRILLNNFISTPKLADWI